MRIPSRRHHRSGRLPVRRAVALGLAGAGLALAHPAPPQAVAASTCAAAGIGVTPLQSNVFYIDVATNYLGSYVGYRTTNTGGATRTGLWQRLENFTGGVMSPADGGLTTAAIPLDALAAGAATPTYAYLKASAATATPQGHDVVIYDGRPGAGGVEVCRETQGVAAVLDVIKAAANKVTGGTAPSAATLGGTFDLTVTGTTGTIGAGPGVDPGIVRFSPAVAANWPSSAFRLVGVAHRIPSSGSPVVDVLSRSGLSGADRPYAITYTFRVVGPTASPTTITPVQNIASGTQVKHTDPATLAALAPIPTVTNTVTMGVTAGPAGPYGSGDTVTVGATATNTGSQPVTLDGFTVRMPAGWSYAPGSATAGGASADDPHMSGGTLTLVGPFTVPANSSLAVGLDLVAGAPGTSGAVTAVGTLAGGQIDATLAPGDDAPASVAVSVLGPPDAVDDILPAATDLPSRLAVLDNDALSQGVPTLALHTPPSHGAVTIVGDRISYLSDPGYSGPDSFVYTLSTPAGSDTATVTLNVGAPPAAPTPPALASAGTGTAPQSDTATVPSGGEVTLLDGGVTPATTVTVGGVGVYDLDPDTGVITFTPELGYASSPAGVIYRITDAFGQTGTGVYTPAVAAPAAPVPADQVTTGFGTLTQTATLPVPPQGSATLLDASLAPVASLTVPGVGVYALGGTPGTVTFTPVPGYAGTPAPVTYQVTDAYGQTATALYTPTVNPPGAPTPPDLSSSTVGVTPTEVALSVPLGGSATLRNAGGQAVTELTVAGGVYRLIAPGTVRFTPAFGFAGLPAAVEYAVTDAYGQVGTAQYAPTVSPPTGPTASDLRSRAAAGAAQRATLPVPAGGAAILLAGSSPATAVEVPGEGSYALQATTGELTFTPARGFSGPAGGVRYRLTDAYGQSAEAWFLPAVDAAATAPEEPAAPVIAPPADPLRPAAGPRARVHTGDTARSGPGGTLPVACELAGAAIRRCDVTLVAAVDGDRRVIGRGSATAPAARRAARVTVWVALTHEGRSEARRTGGVRARALASIRVAGSARAVNAARDTRVVAPTPHIDVRPVLFATDRAAIAPADRAYLVALRSRLERAGVRGVVCEGRTDARNPAAYNRALGMRRARAVCAILTAGSDRWSIRTATTGESRPVATNATPAGMRLNRRTDIRLVW